jgi:hypothetical protein
MFFLCCFSFFGAIWAPPNQPKKVPKGLQVGGMYGRMSKLKNKPLTKALGTFLYKKWSKSTRKLFLYAAFILDTPKWTQKGPQRSASVWNLQANV